MNLREPSNLQLKNDQTVDNQESNTAVNVVEPNLSSTNNLPFYDEERKFRNSPELFREDSPCKDHVPDNISECGNDTCDDSDTESDEDYVYRYSSDDDDSDSDISEMECTFKQEISAWSLQHKITHAALSDLLKILNRRVPEEKFPLDSPILLRTPSHTAVEERAGGEYHHFGLEKSVLNIIKLRITLKISNKNIKILVLTDGAPTGTSSEKNMWPILCSEFTNCELENSTVYPVGIYYGAGKPSCMNEFFDLFVQETINLVNNGVTFNYNLYKIRIFGFVFDAPAKSMALCTNYPNSYHSCCKCEIEGDYIGKRMCYPYDKNVSLRTDEKI
ncbi:hypothetical protein TKK_0000169 [Trichogramma kaykai]